MNNVPLQYHRARTEAIFDETIALIVWLFLVAVVVVVVMVVGVPVWLFEDIRLLLCVFLFFVCLLLLFCFVLFVVVVVFWGGRRSIILDFFLPFLLKLHSLFACISLLVYLSVSFYRILFLCVSLPVSLSVCTAA